MKILIAICVFFLVKNQFVIGREINLGNLFNGIHGTSSNNPTTVDSSVKIDESKRFEENSSSSYTYEFDSKAFDLPPGNEFTGADPGNSTTDYETVPSKDSGESINEPVAEVLRNESYINSNSTISSNESTTLPNGQPTKENESILASDASTVSELNTSTNTADDEQEEVVLVTKEAIIDPFSKTIVQKSIEFVEDPYTLSILIPITAGVVFATTIIIMVALCRCIRRCCRRRRFRRKVLPDSVKNLRPSDRARLLAESSDEEF